MNRKANYIIVTSDRNQVIIQDVGPWDQYPTVTNDAENVVRDLAAKGYLADGRRLFYYGTDGILDEILVKDGAFVGFAPAGFVREEGLTMNKELLRRKTMEIMARHRGPENAIKREELKAQLIIWDGDLYEMNVRSEDNADRAVRRIYTTLPIASSDDGLYLCRTNEELEVFRDYMIKAYGHERAVVRVRMILAYYPGLAEPARPMKQQDLGI